MTKFIAIMVLTLLSNVALAINPDYKMNKELLPIYNALIAQDSNATLIGEEYSVELVLKHASEKHLIFRDAYIRLDEETKYQIAKWQFESHILDSIKDKYDVSCKVTFVIKSVENQGFNESMPHVVAQVLSVTAL
ncbi:hypothetical protein Q4561_17325 [Alteromonas sp. 1_MG-2023]|uniref:hypothetical protein n=1 Tax=Alteromonas sp. 1_MG-2023 TaxID=3062669 RepID=UPI0026E46762|nr:hypothetical protein [Alteromonas sp. 1_MG-2023]MDO6568837.1 hypothetical protein [Alteromonas sp. 1_MG-2023]